VRITGVATIETDPGAIAAIWEKNPLLRQYLGTPENPQFVLYRIDPTQVRFMREWALEYFEVG
jgi:general stress protein 26